MIDPNDRNDVRALKAAFGLRAQEVTEGEEFVYLLVDDEDRIVYVGRSTRPYNRIREHRTDKEFARVFFIRDCDARKAESQLIRVYNPHYNKISAVGSASATTLCVNVDEDLARRIRLAALAEAKSVSAYVRDLLDDFVPQLEDPL